MKIAVIDDYPDAFRQLDCYTRLEGHDVQIYNASGNPVNVLNPEALQREQKNGV